jgi:hypothetical protein
MSVQNILDDGGKIDPAYLAPAAAYGFVTNPLTSPLQCYDPTTLTNHPITEAAFVSAGSIKTDNLEQLPGSLDTQIRCATNLEMATAKQLDFEDNAIITIGGSSARKAFHTEDATPLVGFAKYFMGGGNAIEYAESTKVLTVNRPTVPPSPLLPGQGVVVHGNMLIESATPLLTMYDDTTATQASISYNGTALGLTNTSGNVSIYAPAGNITAQVSAGQYDFANVLSYNGADTM